MYLSWEEKKSSIYALNWYSVNEVIQYLHDLRRYIIYTPAKFPEPYAPKLPEAKLPADKDRRFSDKHYLCEGIGNWNLHLDLLELSANVMLNKNRLTRHYPEYETPGEVEFYAVKKINELLQIIQSGQDFIIQQEDFEELYQLTWTDTNINNNINSLE